MSNMNAYLTLSIIEAILNHGPEAIMAISSAMKVKGDQITPEDIDKLFINKDPESYFEEVK